MKQSALNHLDDSVPRHQMATGALGGAPNTFDGNNLKISVTDGASLQWDHNLPLFNDAIYDQAGFLGAKLWGANRLRRLALQRNGQTIAAAQVFLFHVTGELGGGIAYV